MIKFDHKEEWMIKAFGVPKKSEHYVKEMWDILLYNIGDKNKNVTWSIQRVWADEKLCDASKLFLVFSLGRMYNKSHNLRSD